MKTLRMEREDSIDEHIAKFRMMVSESKLDKSSPVIIDLFRETLSMPLVFEGPVRSGFFPFLGQTGTATGSYFFSKYEKPGRTAHNRLCAVRPGLKVGFDRLGHNRS